MAIALFAVVLVSGCGFHLRGAQSMPAAMAVTYIEGGDPFGPLVTDSRRQLVLSGVKVTANRDEAGAILQILDERSDRRVLSVGATGKAREFELHHSVAFRVLSGAGEELVPRRELSLTRDFVFDETEVLGKASEEDAIRRDMQRDIAAMMMLQIRQLLN